MSRQEELEGIVRESGSLVERLEMCRARIGKMCSERRPPKMTIPVQWNDDDFFISVTLKDAQQCLQPTNGGLALRACVSAHCGWVGKESACLTWKHAGDERMCPHCHDNTEPIPLSAISG